MATKFGVMVDYRTVQQLVTERIRAAILDGTLKPNETINQAELARRLNVSRIPTREALRTLEGEGLIKSQPHRKAAVATMVAEEIRDVYEIRAVLEIKAAVSALKGLTTQKVEAMRRLHDEMTHEADPDRWSKLNNEFHIALYHREGAARLLMVIEMLRNWVAGYVRLLVSDPAHRRVAETDHARILKAVERRDAKRLRREIDRHLRTSCEGVVASLECRLRDQARPAGPD